MNLSFHCVPKETFPFRRAGAADLLFLFCVHTFLFFYTLIKEASLPGDKLQSFNRFHGSYPLKGNRKGHDAAGFIDSSGFTVR